MELHSTSPKLNLSVHHSPYCSIGFLSTRSKFPALKFRVAISSVEHHFFYQYFTISSTYYTLILSSLESIDPDLSVLSVPLYFLNNFYGSSPDYLQLHLSSNTQSSCSDPAQASSLFWRLEEVLIYYSKHASLHHMRKKYEMPFSTTNSCQMSLPLVNFSYFFLSALNSHSQLWPSQYIVHI